MSLFLVADTRGWTANQPSMDLTISYPDPGDVRNFMWLPARKFERTSFKGSEWQSAIFQAWHALAFSFTPKTAHLHNQEDICSHWPTVSSWLCGKGGILQSVSFESCPICGILQRITRKAWGTGWSGTNCPVYIIPSCGLKATWELIVRRLLWSASKQRLSAVGRVIPREVNHCNEKISLVGSMYCYLHDTPSHWSHR